MWIWKNKDWPVFKFDVELHQTQITRLEQTSKIILGRLEALSMAAQCDAMIDLMVTEAVNTSDIEGVKLNREPIRDSIKILSGLLLPNIAIKDPATLGISSLVLDVTKQWKNRLSKSLLCDWQKFSIPLSSLKPVLRGMYRTEEEIISGNSTGDDSIYYQAPPPGRVDFEMKKFLCWYNESSPIAQRAKLPGTIRAGIAHLWFEIIHPFEDGNGRVGRAITDHALSQAYGHPILSGLSTAITEGQENKTRYYNELEFVSKNNMNIDRWISYFLDIVEKAQNHSYDVLSFVIAKRRFYENFDGKLNQRQEKVLSLMFDTGMSEFEGGLSAKKYMVFGKCSKSTATRDLQALLSCNAIRQLSGGGRNAKYEISLPVKESFLTQVFRV